MSVVSFEFLGHVFVADVAIGDEAHADFGVGIGVDDGGRDRPDLALGALDQRPHRAGGVEHEGDLDDRLARGRAKIVRRGEGWDGKNGSETSGRQGPRNAC